MKKVLWVVPAVFTGVLLLTLQHEASLGTEISAALKDSPGAQQRIDDLIVRYDKAVKRLESDLDRYENILATWEKQQKQYQAYLDSLKRGMPFPTPLNSEERR